jgi:hypothetical protein
LQFRESAELESSRSLLERLTLNELGRNKTQFTHSSNFVDGQYVRMIKAPRLPGFENSAAAVLLRGNVGRKDF